MKLPLKSFSTLPVLALLAVGCVPSEQPDDADAPVVVEENGVRAISELTDRGAVITHIVDVDGRDAGQVEWTERQLVYTFGSIQGSAAVPSTPVVEEAGRIALVVWKAMPGASSGSRTEYITCSGSSEGWACVGEDMCRMMAVVNSDCSVDVWTLDCYYASFCHGLPQPELPAQ